MPFDTTYYIPAGENRLDIKYFASGGRDTAIYLKKGELPPHIDKQMAYFINKQIQVPIPKKVDHYTPSGTMVVIFVAALIFILLRVKKELNTKDENASGNFNIENKSAPVVKQPYMVYYGEELNFSDEELIIILNKHFPYFTALTAIQQSRFLQRQQDFIATKTFKIHDTIGYKEMPVLISAAAIQLTFGLKKYLLPNFEFIHIYPEEFMRVQDTICFLEGNVSGHAINLSWKHFLKGYQNPTDGQNVGLHELSHALYYQTFIVAENVDNNFRSTFDSFNEYGNKVFNRELQVGNDLYSDYALKNFQEFWAESAEIFFEKPAELKACYPKLYDIIKLLLNQDPYNKIASVIT